MLTKREFQVFRIMALGYTHPRISKVMKVLPSGIKTYKTNIYKKLDVFYPANKTFMYPLHVKKLDTDLKNLGLVIQKLFKIEELKMTETKTLRDGLEYIAAQKDMTLLGSPLDSEFDRGHQLGANLAFGQAAELAQDALDYPYEPDPVREAAAELLEALRELDALWSKDFPEGPEKSRKFISDEHRELWVNTRNAIAKAEGKI